MISAKEATMKSHPNELYKIQVFIERAIHNETNYVIVAHLCETNKNILISLGYVVTYELINEQHQWCIIW